MLFWWNQAFYLPEKISAPRQQKLQNKGHRHSLCTVDFEQVLAHWVDWFFYWDKGHCWNPIQLIDEVIWNKKICKDFKGAPHLLRWVKAILSLSTAFPFSSVDFSTWYFLTEPSSKELYIELIQQNIYIYKCTSSGKTHHQLYYKASLEKMKNTSTNSASIIK